MKKFLLFVSFLAFLLPVNVWACSCIGPTVKEAREWADVVFTAEATKVQYVDIEGDKMFGKRRIIVTFTVTESWKGDVGKTITLHTVYNRVSCGGYFFKEGEKFIVYAKKYPAKDWLGTGDRRLQLSGVSYPKPEDLIFETALCTRTNFLAQASEDLKALGKGQTPK